MQGLNRCTFLGNLGADPELKVTGGGQAVLKFRMAVTTSYADRNNVRQEQTEWITCTVWGRRAEALGKILSKGDRVYVEGKWHTSQYEKNGEKRYSTECTVSDVILNGTRGEGGALGGRSRGSGGSRGSSSGASGGEDYGTGEEDYGSTPTGGAGAGAGSGDDDIPF